MSTNTSKDTPFDHKQLRAIGHKLKPIVTVGGNGLSETVIAELDRALTQHELIKVKLAVGSREAKAAVSAELCDTMGAELVQGIGNIILVLRRAENPDPRLSNLIRAL